MSDEHKSGTSTTVILKLADKRGNPLGYLGLSNGTDACVTADQSKAARFEQAPEPGGGANLYTIGGRFLAASGPTNPRVIMRALPNQGWKLVKSVRDGLNYLQPAGDTKVLGIHVHLQEPDLSACYLVVAGLAPPVSDGGTLGGPMGTPVTIEPAP